MTNEYKISKLVSDVPKFAKHYDQNLHESGGMIIAKDHTMWVGNMDHGDLFRCLTHYDLHGNPIGEPIPFPLAPIGNLKTLYQSLQIQLINNLLDLERVVKCFRDGFEWPKPRVNNIPPYVPLLGTITKQPSVDELEMRQFYDGPNGYFDNIVGVPVNIDYLMTFCILHPNSVPNTYNPPYSKNFNDALTLANNLFPKLLVSWNDNDLKLQYCNYLLDAQTWSGFLYPISDMDQIVSKDILKPVWPKDLPLYNQFPIGLKEYQNQLFITIPRGLVYRYSSSGGLTGLCKINLVNLFKFVIYTGITATHDHIFIADFSGGKVAVFDTKGNSDHSYDNKFHDKKLPSLYAPYNLWTYEDKIYVLYAKIDKTSQPRGSKIDFGKGNGLINVFTKQGDFIDRAVTKKKLNAPWSIIHKCIHGKKCFLIANHGDGHILVYDHKWNYLYRFKYTNTKHKGSISGLYSVQSHEDKFYFSASPNEDVSGLIGKIKSIKH